MLNSTETACGVGETVRSHWREGGGRSEDGMRMNDGVVPRAAADRSGFDRQALSYACWRTLELVLDVVCGVVSGSEVAGWAR